MNYVLFLFDQEDINLLSSDRLYATDITRAVGQWIVGVLALPTIRMPDGSYTLVLISNFTLEHTSNVFYKV